jgi:four helix bundle protein
MKESPIFTRSYDLMAWLIPRTLAFPKSQRGVLARQVQAQVFACHEALVEAAQSADKRPHLARADASLTKLRTYLRLCRDLQLLSVAQYGYASQQVAEVGRLLGGWIRSLEHREAAPAE